MHPFRTALHDELHARPSIYFNEPAHIYHLTLLECSDALDSIVETLDDLAADALQGLVSLDGYATKWERHTEFLSLTMVVPKQAHAEFWPPLPESLAALIRGHEELLIECSQVLVESAEEWGGSTGRYGFRDPCGSQVGAGDAVIWSDFRLTPDGVNRILLVNHNLNAYRLGRMVRRLLEIETYRMMASLTLPVAKDVARELRNYERKLTELSDQNAHSSSDARQILKSISDLSSRIVRLTARTRQRFSATEAYAQIVFERIAELRESHVLGRQRLGVFIERRFRPTVRYCSATHQRMERVKESVANLGELLQTRVQVEVEEQNGAILHSLNERATTQIKIQKAVEGLSIIAISYYLLSLLKLLYEGARSLGLDLSPRDASLYAAPVVVLVLGTIIRRIRKAQRE
ncbi:MULTISPECIES: DUF3422 domain-containing protein [Pseudomonas]|uniref:Uncharacterized membrane-anchored protein n=1 Tax=Pseudomonas sihuiensis TaxID=1274359 RepID=A0A1H2M3R3_9PSED|nr:MULTISPECIES: DUF3422 domain-containing protein [Pseudomonas]UFQ97328.1 DUF3422 domain-containing protein [Pseudomonas wenzhouensis]SDU87126.1 Uncharacterized membrane-anchored protein [Pseudomonas sihuiensis]